MICPLCKEKGIRCVSPVWYSGKIVEACRDCILKLNLKGIDVKLDRGGTPHWKAHILAILE